MRSAHKAIGRRATDVTVLLAVLLLLAACGAGASAVSRDTSSSPSAMPPENAIDATFAAHVRAKGWAPNVPSNQDGSIAIDAQSFCDELASQPADVVSIRNDLRNAALDDAAAHGIGKAQAQALLLFSVTTYCPDKLSMVQQAFG